MAVRTYFINYYDENDVKTQSVYRGSYADAYAAVANRLAGSDFEFADVFEDDSDDYSFTIDKLGGIHFDDRGMSFVRI